MYEASCEARNATTPATSSGWPNRFIGTFVRTLLAKSSIASCGNPVLPNIGVTIGPGATVFTRIPRSTSSAAAVLAKERNAAFVAEYALAPAIPVLPATLVFKMIDAPSFSSGSAFWIVKYAPLMLMSNFSSYRLSDVSASGANFATPAFTNNTSILPNFFETSAYSLSMSASLATSACTASTPLPIVFTASSSVFLLRPAIATRAPSSWRRFAEASPMPLFPPVTTATFPSSLFMIISRLGLRGSESLSAVAIHTPLSRLSEFQYLDEYRSIWLHAFGPGSPRAETFLAGSVAGPLHFEWTYGPRSSRKNIESPGRRNPPQDFRGHLGNQAHELRRNRIHARRDPCNRFTPSQDTE